MSEQTPTYATYKEFCGNREQPWVTLCSEAVDWTQQPTTRDQVRIGLSSTRWRSLARRSCTSGWVIPSWHNGLPAGCTASMA